MLFNSFAFFVYLPIVFGLYWMLRNNLRAQNLLVVVASYVFYGWWDWRFLILIAFTSAWSYVAGLIESRRWEHPGSKAVLTVSLVVNLSILGYFKYCGFFVSSALSLLQTFGCDTSAVTWRSLDIILPVGISFYTFQALSYTVDVYRRAIRPAKDPIAFFAFISFFPQLVAGPIERATNLLPQFLAPKRFDYPEAVLGCRQMLWGFFKKMVVADNCAAVVDRFLSGDLSHNGFAVLIGSLLFAIQIYGDFSGYSDIAIGCAKLFGVKLMRNFDCPYFARDIAEFWRRWHISLTTWFRDYLYIPLGGSRCGTWKRVRNTFAIFLVSGFWHGANWTFVLWGAFHATLFLPLLLRHRNRVYLDVVAHDRALPNPRECVSMFWTFLLVAAGLMIFRAPDIATYGHWVVSLCDIPGWGALGKPPDELWPAVIASLGMFAVEWFNRREAYGFARLPCNMWLRNALYLAVWALIFVYTPGGTNFIYFQF